MARFALFADTPAEPVNVIAIVSSPLPTCRIADGAHLPVIDWVRRLKCSRCGGRRVDFCANRDAEMMPMIHRRRILAALAIMTLPVVAHGQRVPQGLRHQPQAGRQCRRHLTRGIHRHPAVAPRAGAGREVAGAGMVIVGFGPRGDGDGDGGSKSPAGYVPAVAHADRQKRSLAR